MEGNEGKGNEGNRTRKRGKRGKQAGERERVAGPLTMSTRAPVVVVIFSRWHQGAGFWYRKNKQVELITDNCYERLRCSAHVGNLRFLWVPIFRYRKKILTYVLSTCLDLEKE